MSLTLKYSDPRGIEEPAVLVSLGSNARFGTLEFGNSAEIGQPSVSQITLDDPGGIYDFVGLRAFDVRETAAASNNQMIGRYVIQDRTVTRNPERSAIVGADRTWTLDLVDYNWHLGKRILTDADAKRPAETAGDRIRWLLNGAAHFSLYDYGNVSYPTDSMDAADYRGQRPIDLLTDCAIESGYLFWCDFNEAHGRPELFFINPDGDDYTSTLAISNDLDDVDQVATFAPYEDATLKRTATAIAYGVYLAYSGGAVYVRNDVVGQQFAKIDQTAPMANVKSSTRARRIANKFLNDNDEEADRITCEIKVPVASVNDIRHGQRVAVKFTHFPGYEDWSYLRVLRRTVMQDEEGGAEYYRIALELVGPGEAVPALPPAAVGFLMAREGDLGAYPGAWSFSLEADGVEVLTHAQLSAGEGTVIAFDTPVRATTWRVRMTINWDTVFMPALQMSYALLIGADGTDLFGNGWTPGGTDIGDRTSLSTQTFVGTGPSDGFSLTGHLATVAVGPTHTTLTLDQTGGWSLHQTDIINNVVRTMDYYWTWTVA